jgi:hypothetical protein
VSDRAAKTLMVLKFEVVRLKDRSVQQHLDIFMVKLNIFFSWKMLEEFSLLAFSPARLFLIGVDWSASELLVKWQLSEEAESCQRPR